MQGTVAKHVEAFRAAWESKGQPNGRSRTDVQQQPSVQSGPHALRPGNVGHHAQSVVDVKADIAKRVC